MKTEDEKAVYFMQGIAECQLTLYDLSHELRLMSIVDSADSDIEISNHGNISIDMYISAELNTGSGMTWAVTTDFINENWLTEYRVSFNKNIAQSVSSVIYRSETRISGSVHGCLEDLKYALYSVRLLLPLAETADQDY